MMPHFSKSPTTVVLRPAPYEIRRRTFWKCSPALGRSITPNEPFTAAKSVKAVGWYNFLGKHPLYLVLPWSVELNVPGLKWKIDRAQVLWARETAYSYPLTLVFTKTAGCYNLVEAIISPWEGHFTHLTCHVGRYLSNYTILEIRNAIWEIKRPEFGNQIFV